MLNSLVILHPWRTQPQPWVGQIYGFQWFFDPKGYWKKIKPPGQIPVYAPDLAVLSIRILS